MQMEQLQKDMIAAMKARDKVRKDAISALVSAVKKVAIDEGCREDIPAMKDTDSVLTLWYGDYMQLPPEDKRGGEGAD